MTDQLQSFEFIWNGPTTPVTMELYRLLMEKYGISGNFSDWAIVTTGAKSYRPASLVNDQVYKFVRCIDLFKKPEAT